MMRFTANGIGIEYEVNGPRTGIPVVLIHGFPFSKEMWKPQVEVLKNRYYTITYDIRGHGRSDVGDGQYTVELFVDDFIALLDHLKISRAVVAGLSMGGYIALRAIERHPERFRGLVLCDTRSEADNNEGKIRRATQAKSVKLDGMKKFAETFVAGLFYEGTFQRNPEIVELIKSIIGKTSPLAVAGTFIALAARTDTTASLYGIKVPTLILVGRHDSLTPPSASSAMKEKIPNAEMFVLPKAAHMSNLECTDEFNERLADFLSRIP
ncbi:MAG: alpha/beta fold hydrolase [Ignavibacteriae bacterium]|nr:alpha/beta fold hydrolase [Ignavibacteria bacterium]MBI3363931.1 alpha/beta fold hydrolase [Ignavibacteriota bacterium]